MKIIRLIVAFTFIGVIAKAQSELTLPSMTDVFQSSYINPSVWPEHSVSVGLPTNISIQAINTGFMFDEFIRFRNDSTTSININSFYDGLKDRNMLHIGQNMDIFHVRFKVQNAFYWFSVRENFNNSLFFAKDLFGVIMEGTEPYIGSSLDFSDMKLKSSAYLEYSLGMSMKLRNWTFGARLSLLKGVANVDFNPKQLELQIEDDTWVNSVVADAEIKTSGLPRNNDGDFDMNGNWIKSNVLKSKNNGFALSAGVTYKFDEKLSASFSFYDLGYINWKSNMETYKVSGRFDISGVDIIAEFLDNSAQTIEFDSLINGFKDAFETDTIIGGSYKTWLNPKFDLSATYKLASRTSISAQFHATYNTTLYPAFTIGLSQGFGRFFFLTANMSYAYRTLRNFGLGLVIKPGPVQFYVATDNYYPLLGNDKLLSFTNTSVRVGINLVFGRVSKPDGMPLW